MPKTAFTSWETTVGDPPAYGTAWVHLASSVTPSTRKPSVVLMITSVRRAFCASGRWKLLTPFEIASSPVSDEPPLANERSREMKARPISQPSPGVPILPP